MKISCNSRLEVTLQEKSESNLYSPVVEEMYKITEQRKTNKLFFNSHFILFNVNVKRQS